MRGDLTSKFRSASVRVGHISQLEVDHAVPLKHVESVSERADHRTVADSGDIFETGNCRHGGTNRRPVVATEVPLHGKSKHPALFIRLRQAERLYDALQFLSVLQKLQRIIGLRAWALGRLG